ncbi:MAG: hypothetical protein AAF940_13625 [Pseudomonadota bacterium]
MNDFNRNVFINCPFDDAYAAILQSVMFTIVRLGFIPRLASESLDGGQNRLQKIVQLIEASRFSVHDLSRCVAAEAGEHFRMNMPFELGIDYGCRQFKDGAHKKKRFLILEEERFRYQAALSDLSGCDIETHAADYQKAVRKVRNWLVLEADAQNVGAQRILNDYSDFQEWYVEKHLAAGASEADIYEYPTRELLKGMQEWMEAGMPPSFN